MQTGVFGGTALSRRADRALAAFLFISSLAFAAMASASQSKPARLNPPPEYLHRLWQAEDGLAASAVRGIMQSRDGYLWMATDEGLARFDGVQFREVERKDVFDRRLRWIVSVLETRDGSIWASSVNRGLIRFRNGRIERFETSALPERDIVLALHEDRDGILWVGTVSGLARFQNETLEFVEEPSALMPEAVRAFTEDRDGNLWIGTAVGLVRHTQGTYTAYTTDDLLAHGSIMALCEGRDGTLWIGTAGGLSSLKDGQLRHYTVSDGIAHNTVRALHEDQNGVLWVGTHGGLQQFLGGEFRDVPVTDSLSLNRQASFSDYAYTIFEDREGSIWVGSNLGLNRLRQQIFHVVSTQEGLSHDQTTLVYEDRSNAIWVGTFGGGLNRLRDGEVTHWDTERGLASNHILSILEDSKGRLWIGHDGAGVNRLEADKVSHFRPAPDAPRNIVRVLFEDSRGAIWMGTNNDVRRYADGDFGARAITFGLPFVTVMIEDRAGNVWIGSQGGLMRWHETGLDHFTREDGLSGDFVTALHEDAEGALWIGTERGILNRLKDGKFLAFVPESGVIISRITHILEDDRGNLWLGSRNGIHRISKKELTGFGQGAKSGFSVVSFGKADGMRRAQCTGVGQPAGLKAGDGRFWFPTVNGVVVFDPSRLERSGPPPPVIIEQVIVDGQAFDAFEDAEFPPGRGRIDFHYTALSLNAPEKIRFRYKLQGVDAQWTQAGNRRVASYSNLRPGRYNFLVNACDEGGVWAATDMVYAFALSPHFYQTSGFYAACGLLAIFFGAGVYGIRARRIRARQDELIRLVDERTRELQQEVKDREKAEQALRLSQQIAMRQERLAAVGQLSAGVAHEFNNILTIIQGHASLLIKGPNTDDVSRKALGHILKSAERAASLTRQMLAFSRKQFMQSEVLDLNETIRPMLKILGKMLGENIVVTCQFDSKLPSIRADAAMLEQIVMNLSVNARHAIQTAGRQGQVTIATKSVVLDETHNHPEARPGGFVRLSVSDNGCGMDAATVQQIFEPFFTTKEVGQGTGLGLASVHGIVHQHQGWIEVWSRPGEGTRFDIYLPATTGARVRPAAAAAGRNAGGKEAILVVEDEAGLRSLVRGILAGYGYQIYEAADGDQAMKIWQDHGDEIHLLFTDLMMPGGLSGWELAAKLRKKAPELKVIYTSGYSVDLFGNNVNLRAGLNFLPKPYQPEKLGQLVRDSLDGREEV